MRTQDALAAGQGGAEIVPAPPKGEVLAPQSRDERLRQDAVETLAATLADSATLLAGCKAMARAKRGDRLGPIYAAARLMNAHAQVARALALVGLVEHRSRTIVETIQTPDPKIAELNSRFASHEDDEDMRAALQRRFAQVWHQGDEEQERLDALNIGCCI